MNQRVTKRFIKIAGYSLLIAVLGWLAFDHFYVSPAPGDFEVRAGNIHLDIKQYDEALEDYNAALLKSPDHRGGLMGKAISYHLSKRPEKAEVAYTYLINFLSKKLEADDKTGTAVLAGAYANRGILKDQDGRHKQALEDYIKALKTDAEAVKGAGVVDKILHIVDPSTVRKRAEYLLKQFKLPEEKRVFFIPEIDKKQRMVIP
jgi:tetratricopeptide (TPR) repeat protein